MKKYLKQQNLLLIILILTTFFHLFRLNFPEAYVFDEVYHGFTAKEYLKGNIEAWEYWTSPPKGVAYEWTHPPLAKEMMALSMSLVGSTNAWAWRLPGTFLGILSVFLIYLIGKKLFKSEVPSLISAFIFSIEGLNFVQSRIGMNDIYFVTFMLVSFLFFLRKNFLVSALFLGLSLASKWAAIYLIPIYIILIIKDRHFKQIPYFLLLIPLIYLVSYIPFFILGHSWDQFIALQQQMWWYHTGLKATHDYASRWWSWPLNLYPVWYYVNYDADKIGNIFASGNPLVFWSGAIAIILSIWEFIKKRTSYLFIILLGYFAFWLPWAISPRIMFLYHFSPSVPFLSLALGYQLSKLNTKKDRRILFIILGLLFLGFLLMYPFLTGISLPKDIMKLFFYTNITKNPFG